MSGRPFVIKWWHAMIFGLLSGIGGGVTRSILDDPEGCHINHENKAEIVITCNDR